MNKARILSFSYPFDDPEQGKAFYEALLGVELAENMSEHVEAYSAPAGPSAELSLHRRQGRERGGIAYFAVEDLERAARELEQHGGKRVAGPFEMPLQPHYKEFIQQHHPELALKDDESAGKVLIMEDPGHNQIGIVQLHPKLHEDHIRTRPDHQVLERHRERLETQKKHKARR